MRLFRPSLLPLGLLAAALLTAGAMATDIYKTVDEQGQVIYTDDPGAKKAEKVELPDINTQPAPPPVPRRETSPSEEKPVDYQLRINRPAEGTQVPMGQRQIPVDLSIRPNLRQQHSIRMLLNGEVFGPAFSSASLVLTDVYRGEHQLQAVIVDAEGQAIARSDSVTIYVQRPSRQNPANPANKAPANKAPAGN